MELHEVSASAVCPYRCYVRGNSQQTEGENVKTIGFKDGLAVVQATPIDKPPDNKIDLTKLKKIILKVDPQTGKKYIQKDGKRLEIVPHTFKGDIKTSIVIKPSLILNGAPLPKLVPMKRTPPKNDPVKLQVVSVKQGNKNKGVAVGTMTESNVSFNKMIQTERTGHTVATQTDILYYDDRESPYVNELFNFLLEDSEKLETRKKIDPTKLKSKEEIHKFNFFNDMRNALNFDRSGNLPIHDSVILNDIKGVQKNCVVLKALKENVNILNQHSFAPIHLAIIHNVDLEIVRALIHHEADLTLADPEGNTALHLVIEHRRSQMLRILLKSSLTFNIDVFNYEGFTPLILACQNQSYSDAKLLLEHGADPNIKDMKSGRTALFHAAESHDINLVELLMEHKADTKIRNFFGTSPHDAMFEVDEIPMKIKYCILGRDHQRFQGKKKIDKTSGVVAVKKAKLETMPVLRKVSSSDILLTQYRRK